MEFFEILKAILFGIVQGITEWLPISSTGHMILLDEFVRLDVSSGFMELFLVAVQLGSILAVVMLYWEEIFPFRLKGGLSVDKPKMIMWMKILAASVPAGIVGVLFDDVLNDMFYNYVTVAVMLILFGVLFLVVENWNKGRKPKVDAIAGISFQAAFFIGLFQMIAAVFPGTSRSGSTIIAALLLGIARTTAAEFTFFLAIPAMFGGSAIKLLKFGFSFSAFELMILLIGMLVAYLVSVVAIKFLMVYIKRHDFKPFGWYRIVLGVVVLGYFMVFR